MRAVADAEGEVLIAGVGEVATGLGGELGEEFNAIDLVGQFGE